MGGEQTSGRGVGLRVVIVDDQPLWRESLRMVLEAEGVEVVAEARHGAEGIEVVLAMRPDVVVMDVRMPVMDGIEATRRLKERLPDLPVVVLTAGPEHVEWEAREAGAVGFVSKGSSPDHVADAVVGAARRGREQSAV